MWNKRPTQQAQPLPPFAYFMRLFFFFFCARAKVPASVRKMLRTWRTRTHAREHTLDEGGTRVFGWSWARRIEREKLLYKCARGGGKKLCVHTHISRGVDVYTINTNGKKRGPRASSFAWPSVPREFASCKRLWRTGTLMEWRDLTRTADSRLI